MLSLTQIFLPLVAVALIVGPLYLIFSGRLNTKNTKAKLIAQVCVFLGLFAVFTVVQFHSFSVYAAGDAESTAKAAGYLGAALATGCSSLGAGIAVGKGTPAALGAISEDSDNFGRALIFVALGEGIAIYGLLISILILNTL